MDSHALMEVRPYGPVACRRSCGTCLIGLDITRMKQQGNPRSGKGNAGGWTNSAGGLSGSSRLWPGAGAAGPGVRTGGGRAALEVLGIWKSLPRSAVMERGALWADGPASGRRLWKSPSSRSNSDWRSWSGVSGKGRSRKSRMEKSGRYGSPMGSPCRYGSPWEAWA